ncbi:Protein unc-80, partial [Bienertia sinuspersici]
VDFLSLAPKTWLAGASIDACSYVFNRREEEKPGTPRRFWFNILPFILVPVHIGNHFIVLVFDIQKSMIEDIDNRSDNKSFARYGEKPYDKVYELCHVLQSFFKIIESSVVVLMVFTIGIEGLFLLLGEVIKTTSIVVFIALKLWNGTTVGMRKSIRLLHFQQY